MDARQALAVASALVHCGEWDGNVFVDAELLHIADTLKARELFPEAWCSFGESRLRAGELPEDPEVVARLLPGELDAEEIAGEDVLGRFLPLAAPEAREQLAWMGLHWPAVPELGLDLEYARTGVQMCINSTAEHEPAVGHAVYVHVRGGEDERAHHLAGLVGQAVIGPGEEGW
nr:hypothetical protein [Streptomyces sp. SID8377]